MRSEAYQKLQDDFDWFGGFYPERPRGHFGFECGDGWEPLLRKLCEKLKALDFKGNVVQVKEKFGTLRFYADGMTDEQYKAVHEAEYKSEITCEACGQPGKLRSGGWIRTLCDTCDASRKVNV